MQQNYREFINPNVSIIKNKTVSKQIKFVVQSFMYCVVRTSKLNITYQINIIYMARTWLHISFALLSKGSIGDDTENRHLHLVFICIAHCYVHNAVHMITVHNIQTVRQQEKTTMAMCWNICQQSMPTKHQYFWHQQFKKTCNDVSQGKKQTLHVSTTLTGLI